MLAAAPQEHDRGGRPRRRGRPQVRRLGRSPVPLLDAHRPTLSARRRALTRIAGNAQAASAEGARGGRGGPRRGGRARRAGRSARTGARIARPTTVDPGGDREDAAGVVERRRRRPRRRRRRRRRSSAVPVSIRSETRERLARRSQVRRAASAARRAGGARRAAALRPIPARRRCRRWRARRAGLRSWRSESCSFSASADGRRGDVLGRLVARADLGDRRERGERVAELRRWGSAARSRRRRRPPAPSRIEELRTIPSAAWTASKTLAASARTSPGSAPRTISAERSMSRWPCRARRTGRVVRGAVFSSAVVPGRSCLRLAPSDPTSEAPVADGAVGRRCFRGRSRHSPSPLRELALGTGDRRRHRLR